MKGLAKTYLDISLTKVSWDENNLHMQKRVYFLFIFIDKIVKWYQMHVWKCGDCFGFHVVF